MTIPYSHFSEKARWVLDLAGIPYREESRLPGPHVFATRRRGGPVWLYQHVLNDAARTVRLYGRTMSPGQRAAWRAFFPAIRLLIRNAYGINARSAVESRERILGLFERADAMLAGGFGYLLGESFTVADLTFAALYRPESAAKAKIQSRG